MLKDHRLDESSQKLSCADTLREAMHQGELSGVCTCGNLLSCHRQLSDVRLVEPIVNAIERVRCPRGAKGDRQDRISRLASMSAEKRRPVLVALARGRTGYGVASSPTRMCLGTLCLFLSPGFFVFAHLLPLAFRLGMQPLDPVVL